MWNCGECLCAGGGAVAERRLARIPRGGQRRGGGGGPGVPRGEEAEACGHADAVVQENGVRHGYVLVGSRGGALRGRDAEHRQRHPRRAQEGSARAARRLPRHVRGQDTRQRYIRVILY